MRIEDHPFFAGFATERVATLASEAEMQRFDPGDIIFNEGSPSTHVYLLLDGKVEFSKRVDEDSFHPVSASSAGDFFGEIGVITGEPRSLRVQATSPATVATLNKEQLEGYMRDSAGPLASTLRSVIDHLHRTTRHYLDEVLHREKMAVVGNMVNTIIHDFKNPFSCINLGADYIARHSDDPATLKICDQMHRQVARMLDMAEGVSLYSRGEYQPKVKRLRVADLMDHFRDLNSPFFETENVSISTEADDAEIEAEENTLLRVFQNLVGNAIDAAGGEAVAIRITAKAEGDQLHVTVSDNAGGIPDEIRDRFFEPFVTHGKRGGTGLGSAIVKSIVEAHGGTIALESVPGEGTTFDIRLPRRPQPSNLKPAAVPV